MCQAWQSYGLWMLIVAGTGGGFALGALTGWRANTASRWHARMMVHARGLLPAVRIARTTAVFTAVGALGAYVWLR